MEKYLPCYEKNFFERTEKNVSCEIGLPEYLPNAVKVVKVTARVRTEECEAVKDSLHIGGRVEFSVIYLSDFKDKLKCASVSADITHTFPVKGIEDIIKEGGYFDVCFNVSDEKGQVVSQRKLGASYKVSVCAQVLSVRQTEIFDTEESDNVHKLCSKAEMLGTVKLPTHELMAEETIALDEGMSPISEIVFSDCSVSDISAQCHDGKIFYDGKMNFRCLYLAKDDEDSGQYIAFEKELDLTGSTEIPDIPDGAFIITRACISGISADPSEDNYGETSLCSVSVGISLFSKAFFSREAELLCDAFCTGCECECETRNIAYDAFIYGTNESIDVHEDVRANIGSITDIIMKNISVSVISSELSGKTPVFGMRAVMRLLGSNESGSLESICTSFNFKVQSKHEVPDCTDRCRMETEVCVGECGCRIENGEIKCDLSLNVCYCIYARKSVNTVTALEVDTESSTIRDKAEYILYYPSGNDTVWSCAKMYKVSPKALIAVNGMGVSDNDFGQRKVVVIPRSEK